MSLKCVNLNRYKLVDNLNLVFNATNSTIVLWNKYQIILFDKPKYEDLVNGGQSMHFSELNASRVLLSDNYVISLNYNGDVYSFPLNLNQSAQKHKSSFHKNVEDTLCIYTIDDTLYSLKKEKELLYFVIHKLSSEAKAKILIKNIQLTSSQNKKYIFHCHVLCETDFIYIQEILKTNETWNEQTFVIFSLDKVTLFGFLISKLHHKPVTPIKLFTCPSQISDLTLDRENYLNILISLTSGTLIKLCLNQVKEPKIMHLNIAIHKFLKINDSVIYTDGLTLWKAENVFDKNPSFRQFKVRYIKDFIKDGNQIICTTYNKLIYLFSIDDDHCYLEPPTRDEYCPSEYVINNSICYSKILDEIEKNNQIIKRIKKEENYLTTLALSNRHDIMDEMIKYNIIVYDNYEDILKEGISLKLADNIQEYFNEHSIYFLIKITTTSHLQQKFGEILSNVFGNLKIHINILSEQKVLKTTSIKVLEQLKSSNIVVALCTKINFTNVSVEIKLVTNIPGALNERETLWTCLHYKNIQLNPEHFIRNTITSNAIQLLKEPTKSIADLIYEVTYNHHGLLFKISKIQNSHNPIMWPFYVKLPKVYQELLKNKSCLDEKFNTSKANFLYNEITSPEFLKSRNSLCWIISRERVEIEIINDGISDPLLKVTSQNPEVALGIRNFFSNIVYNNFNNYEREFVNNALYDSLENLEKKIKSCVHNQLPADEFLLLFEQYQKNIIGALPL